MSTLNRFDVQKGFTIVQQFGNHSHPAMSLTESSLSLVLSVTTWVVVGVDHDALFLTSGKSSGVGAPRVISDIERSQSCAI